MRKWTGAALLMAVLAAACGCAAVNQTDAGGENPSALQVSVAETLPREAQEEDKEAGDEAPALPGFSLGIGDAVRDYARVSGVWEHSGEAAGEEQAARIEITWLGTFEAYDADGHILSGGVVEYEEQEDGTFSFGLYDGKHELWNRFADPGEETADTLSMELDGSLYVRVNEEEEEAENPSGWTEAESLADMPAASAIGFVLPPEEAVPSGYVQAELAHTDDAVQVRYAGANGMLTVRAGLHTTPEELAADEYEDYPDQWEDAYGETTLRMLGSAGLANDVLFEADGVSWAILCCPGLVGNGLSQEEVHALIRGLEALPEREKQADYVLEYGASGRWTEEETEEAAAAVMEEFGQMEGCVMYRLSLNEEKSEDSLSYIRELRPAVDFSECIVFDSVFRSPRDAGTLSGWEPDTEYTWDWYLGRIEGGRWQVVTYGY